LKLYYEVLKSTGILMCWDTYS